MNVKKYLPLILALSACSSSFHWLKKNQWESPRSPLSQQGDLRVLVLSSQELTRRAEIHSGSLYRLGGRGILNASPWQWRDRNALGAPVQSLVAPQMIGGNDAIIATVGGGIERRDFIKGFSKWKIEIPLGVASKPFISAERVVFAGLDGVLRSVDINTGKEIWKAPLHSESLGGISSLQSFLFVTAADNSLWCVREGTGEVVWTYKRPAPEGPVIWSLRGQATPGVGMDGKTLFVGFSDGVFVALDALTGKTNWERRFERTGLFKDADTSPIVLRNGRAVVLPLVDGDLMALNVKDGSVLWTQKIGNFASPLYDAAQDKLYVPGGDGSIHRLAADTGISEWTYDLGFKGIATQPVFTAGEYIAFTTSHFGLVILNKSTGKKAYEHSLGSGSTTPVASDGKRLLVMNSRNLLIVFQTESRAAEQKLTQKSSQIGTR